MKDWLMIDDWWLMIDDWRRMNDCVFCCFGLCLFFGGRAFHMFFIVIKRKINIDKLRWWVMPIGQEAIRVVFIYTLGWIASHNQQTQSTNKKGCEIKLIAQQFKKQNKITEQRFKVTKKNKKQAKQSKMWKRKEKLWTYGFPLRSRRHSRCLARLGKYKSSKRPCPTPRPSSPHKPLCFASVILVQSSKNHFHERNLRGTKAKQIWSRAWRWRSTQKIRFETFQIFWGSLQQHKLQSCDSKVWICSQKMNDLMEQSILTKKKMEKHDGVISPMFPNHPQSFSSSRKLSFNILIRLSFVWGLYALSFMG